MNKISYVQIGNTAPIPLAAKSDNIDVNGYTLTEVLGDMINKDNIAIEINSESTNNEIPTSQAVYNLFTSIVDGEGRSY